MFNVELGQEYKVAVNSGSKGTQIKYKKANFWYKEDNAGNEGMVEFLVSLVLKYSSLNQNGYVVYEFGKINGKCGCRSSDFTDNGKYTFSTLQRLYDNITGKDLYKKIISLDTPEQRRDYVLDFFAKYYQYDLTGYFDKIFTLDMITLNEDRHFNNLGILIDDTGTVSDAPIFDNGRSLLNGNYSVRPAFSVSENVKRVAARPFSGSPERQYGLFSHAFTIDYVGLYAELKQVPDSYQKKVLEYQLERYRGLFDMQG